MTTLKDYYNSIFSSSTPTYISREEFERIKDVSNLREDTTPNRISVGDTLYDAELPENCDLPQNPNATSPISAFAYINDTTGDVYIGAPTADRFQVLQYDSFCLKAYEQRTYEQQQFYDNAQIIKSIPVSDLSPPSSESFESQLDACVYFLRLGRNESQYYDRATIILDNFINQILELSRDEYNYFVTIDFSDSFVTPEQKQRATELMIQSLAKEWDRGAARFVVVYGTSEQNQRGFELMIQFLAKDLNWDVADFIVTRGSSEQKQRVVELMIQSLAKEWDRGVEKFIIDHGNSEQQQKAIDLIIHSIATKGLDLQELHYIGIYGTSEQTSKAVDSVIKFLEQEWSLDSVRFAFINGNTEQKRRAVELTMQFLEKEWNWEAARFLVNEGNSEEKKRSVELAMQYIENNRGTPPVNFVLRHGTAEQIIKAVDPVIRFLEQEWSLDLVRFVFNNGNTEQKQRAVQLVFQFLEKDWDLDAANLVVTHGTSEQKQRTVELAIQSSAKNWGWFMVEFICAHGESEQISTFIDLYLQRNRGFRFDFLADYGTEAQIKAAFKILISNNESEEEMLDFFRLIQKKNKQLALELAQNYRDSFWLWPSEELDNLIAQLQVDCSQSSPIEYK